MTKLLRGLVVEDLTSICEFDETPECGCPHLHLHINYCCLDIHFEPDGELHIVLGAGDWEAEITIYNVPSIEDACTDALHWAHTQIMGPVS